MSELEVVIEGDLIGRVRINKAGRLSFEYESGWRDSRSGYSLSVNMRLADITYSHSAGISEFRRKPGTHVLVKAPRLSGIRAVLVSRETFR